MRPNAFSWALFANAPIVGIVRNLSMDDMVHILPLYRDAGLTTIEITMNTPNAEAIIRYALDHHRTGMPDHGGLADGLNVGAGTVCTMADLEKALTAGAQFIVTPVIDEQVIQTCVQRRIPIFPGAFTPSEIYKAWSLGASLVKVFPATSLGPAYVSDLKAPLGQIKLLPTGGITRNNLTDYLKAGAYGVGIGSHLFDKTLIREQNWTGLGAHFRQFADQLATVPKSQPTIQ
ncbi:bifunctional 4-hydroxy-2-oxoglutarate aldolase/2-dehydro-3-deoxy-phosphogluconate aldolase [Spirosoma arcticum]